MKCLACAVKEKLGSDATETPFSPFELFPFEATSIRESDIISLATKLSQFSQTLDLYPYNKKQKLTGTLNPISYKSIQPVLMICSRSSVCLTSGCNQCFLKQNTGSQDIPRVTLIKGTDVYHDVQLLSGCCGKCGTIYYADHEHIPAPEGIEAMKFFLNSANYLQVGQKLWVNCEFSSAVLNHFFCSFRGVFGVIFLLENSLLLLHLQLFKTFHHSIFQNCTILLCIYISFNFYKFSNSILAHTTPYHEVISPSMLDSWCSGVIKHWLPLLFPYIYLSI